MPGLVPGIHVFLACFKAWMAGTGPAMTTERDRLCDGPGFSRSGMKNAAPRPGHRGYGVMLTGEKSTNQLFGCTKPLIFELIARGATSWAT
jgi:hypothetical protein